MEQIKREIEITVKGEQFKLKFPTIGDYMAIERYKMNLSAGQYTQMANSNLLTFVEALDAVDMIAYFTVLAPDILKHLKVEMYSELDLLDAKPLLDVYKEEVKPWIDSWMKILASPTRKKEKVEKE